MNCICMSRTVIAKTTGIRGLADYSVENVLSSDNLMRAVSKFQTMPAIRMQTRDPLRKAAVLIPLCVVDNKVSLLYTLRASHLRAHKGQVSFPGGMQDTKDKNLQSTALRETKEELGIDEKKIKIWGMGNVIISRTDPSVLPVIGTIHASVNIKKLAINPSEVEEVFTVPLEILCKPESIAFTQFKSGYSAPVYVGAPKRIWGLTAIITHSFLKCLLPPSAYTHKMKFIPPVTARKSGPKSSYKV